MEPERVENEARGLEAALTRLCGEALGRPFVWREGVPASFGIKGDTLGGRVHVNRALAQPDRVRAVAHEIAHVLDRGEDSLAERELVAEGAAMLVLEARGLGGAVPYWMPRHLEPADLARLRRMLAAADAPVSRRAQAAAGRMLADLPAPHPGRAAGAGGEKRPVGR